jgi:hypothetical protein
MPSKSNKVEIDTISSSQDRVSGAQSNTECTGREGVVSFLLMNYNEGNAFDIGIGVGWG